MSSDITLAPDIRVWKVFKYCQDKFGKAGIKITFPKDTDPKKTYKWRYLLSFIKKIDEMQASIDTTHQLINAVVKYAASNNQLHKGLSLLTSDKVLEACCNIALQSGKSESNLLDKIKKDRDLVESGDLLGKKHERGMSNIVRWYIEGSISDLYLSLSKKCHETMMQLSKIERSMMPNGKELILTRMDILNEPKLKAKIRKIMLNDWREILN